VSSTVNVEVMTSCQVVGFDANGRLRQLLVAPVGGGDPSVLPVEALFICIGGEPRTDHAIQAGAITDPAGYLLTGNDLARDPKGSRVWPLPQPPLPLETNLPSVFAAGDVRHGSIKRCAAAIGEGAMAVAMVHRRLAGASDG
jgi:thioredoxin reductase (NADPH)